MGILQLTKQNEIKRYFSARNKISAPGIISHVTQRATGSEPLFLEPADYLHMLGLIKEISEKFSLEFFAFVLMPNHLHLLFELTKNNLSKAMHNIFFKYASYINRKYQRKGNLFCGRYRQAVCFDEVYLIVISLYIHLNPVRAGIVSDYSKYGWSSWKLYCKDGEKRTFLKYRRILEILNPDIKKARGVYKELLEDSVQIKKEEILEKPKAIEKFKNSLLEKFPSIFTAIKQEISENVGYDDDIKLQQEVSRLKRKKSYYIPQERKAINFLIRQLLSRGFNKKEIACKLNISRTTLYKYL